MNSALNLTGRLLIAILFIGGAPQKVGDPTQVIRMIESLGLPGFGYHSNQAEYVDISAIPRRLYLATRLIMDLSTQK